MKFRWSNLYSLNISCFTLSSDSTLKIHCMVSTDKKQRFCTATAFQLKTRNPHFSFILLLGSMFYSLSHAFLLPKTFSSLIIYF